MGETGWKQSTKCHNPGNSMLEEEDWIDFGKEGSG
jgi:hypothetical protein